MKPNHSYAGAVLVTFLAIVACVLPGQAAPPAPNTDPISIEAAVAGTAQAAAALTEQAKPVPATETATVNPANAPLSAEVTSTYGTSLVKLADGSTQFRDYRAGMQIIFPANWLAVRSGEPEYYEAWEQQATQSQELFQSLTLMQSDDQNIFRVSAFDMHPEHFLYGGFPRVEVVFGQGDTRTLKQLEADERYRGSHSILAGYKFLLADYKEIVGGIQILDFRYQWDSSDSQGVYEDYVALYRDVMFKVPTGTVGIQLYIPIDQMDALLLEQDQIGGSVTLFTP